MYIAVAAAAISYGVAFGFYVKLARQMWREL